MPGLKLLNAIIIAIILFADDMMLLASSKEELQTLLTVLLQYFAEHGLKVSTKKTKLMTFPDGEGDITFIGDYPDSPLTLDIVSKFKYLGVKFSSQPYKLFSDFNLSVTQKCDSFLHSLLSLTRDGPDRSFMALTMWRQIALPSILYGVECIPLTQNTIKKIQNTQNQIAKYALQVPNSSANLQVIIDAGLFPIQFIICQKVLQYANKLKFRPNHNLASVCFSHSFATNSRYAQYVNSQLSLLNTFPHIPTNIPRAIHLAIVELLETTLPQFSSCLVLKIPALDSLGSCKQWLNDTVQSGVYAKFRSLNCNLGNRFQTMEGFSSKICPFCYQDGKIAQNNEIHLVIECPKFDKIREETIIGPLLQRLHQNEPSATSFGLYKAIMDDQVK